MGHNAWDCVAPRLRGGLKLTNPMAAARRAATELRAAGAEILVCLSHTGLKAVGPTNDMDLAAEQIFDVVFSGHEHNEEHAPAGFHVDRTLVHQGVSHGRAVVWAELTVRMEQQPQESTGRDNENGLLPAAEQPVRRRVSIVSRGGADIIDDRYEEKPETLAWLQE